MIAVFILCIAACFGAPILVARTPRRRTLAAEEAGTVAALLAGKLPPRNYRDSMASVARREADHEPTQSWLPAGFRYEYD